MAMVLSLKETAAVAEVSQKVIRHCLRADVVHPARDASSGRWRFSSADALFFAVRRAIPFAMDVEDQKALYEVVAKKKRPRAERWKLVNEHTVEFWADLLRVEVDFSSMRTALERRLGLLARRGERIVSRPDLVGGEPAFAGTRISVSRVGKLVLRGVGLVELRADFPRLSDEDFELAALLVTIGPGPGRPRRRPLELKRAARG